MIRFLVTAIEEPDFGCEGLPEGQEKVDKVYLKSESGQTAFFEVEDKELFLKGINKGDWIYVDAHNEIHKSN